MFTISRAVTQRSTGDVTEVCVSVICDTFCKNGTNENRAAKFSCFQCSKNIEKNIQIRKKKIDWVNAALLG